ncbi:MAG TPA: proline--tRNA ligase, partial [Thermoprotei archaeon]|nr:proline--tRNA ligase [Thermoprotei archaeon]
YTQVVLKAELCDYAPVHGCIVIREYGYAIWERIQEILDKEFKKMGVKNVYFPSLIPESLLSKEAVHFKGFKPEVAWVTHGGDMPLQEKLAIRPTSETIMYYMFSKWIKSWRDLPLKVNQWCNVVRWEIKSTKPFLRTTEFLWQEGHTVHETYEDAEKQVMEILRVYQKLIEDYLAIPVIVGKKSEGEKFAGALYTTTLEAIMPDGRAVQMGTSHHLGQNFAKAFEIVFMGRDGKMHYAWQTSWGVSTRLIGALVMVHGDNRGLVLPPKIAPIQIVIIPIFYSEKQGEKVMKYIDEVKKLLEEKKISLYVDERREKTPGWKFYEWELKGVPLRLEIGPRDVDNRTVVVFRRDLLRKETLKLEEFIGNVKNILEDIQKTLFNRAKELLEKFTTRVKDFNEFKEVIEKKGGFVVAPWCGTLECEEAIKEETGATVRVIPFDQPEIDAPCVYCGSKAKFIAYFAKSY